MKGLFQSTRIRAAVGMIAAYAIALQTLFAAFAPLPANATAADFAQVICFGSGNGSPAGDNGAPAPAAGKFHCVLCASTASAAILPEPVACPLARASTPSEFAPRAAELFIAPSTARSGPSRAPPMTL